MANEIHVGTSGWAYSGWKPEFYPKEVPAKDFLKYYSSKLNSVEVNFTFRSILKQKTADSWIATTPADFLFSIKMHQGVTHFRRLKNVDELLKRFFESLEPFWHAKRLGAILIQLPHNMQSDPQVLDDFLGRLLKGARYAIEFRNPSWLNESVYEVLKSHNAALCVTEGEAELSTPDIATADFKYYRFRRETYSATRIKELSNQFAATALPVFSYFKHEETPEGALNAVKLLNAVQAIPVRKAG
jgi:uncharacterized protein YecE (DUF72 family)